MNSFATSLLNSNGTHANPHPSLACTLNLDGSCPSQGKHQYTNAQAPTPSHKHSRLSILALSLGAALMATGCQITLPSNSKEFQEQMEYHAQLVKSAFENMVPVLHRYYPINSTVYKLVAPEEASDKTKSTYHNLAQVLNKQGAAVCSSAHNCPKDSVVLTPLLINHSNDHTLLISLSTPNLKASALFYDNGKLISQLSLLTELTPLYDALLPKHYQGTPSSLDRATHNYPTPIAAATPALTKHSKQAPKASTAQPTKTAKPAPKTAQSTQAWRSARSLADNQKTNSSHKAQTKERSVLDHSQSARPLLTQQQIVSPTKASAAHNAANIPAPHSKVAVATAPVVAATYNNDPQVEILVAQPHTWQGNMNSALRENQALEHLRAACSSLSPQPPSSFSPQAPSSLQHSLYTTANQSMPDLVATTAEHTAASSVAVGQDSALIAPSPNLSFKAPAPTSSQSLSSAARTPVAATQGSLGVKDHSLASTAHLAFAPASPEAANLPNSAYTTHARAVPVAASTAVAPANPHLVQSHAAPKSNAPVPSTDSAAPAKLGNTYPKAQYFYAEPIASSHPSQESGVFLRSLHGRTEGANAKAHTNEATTASMPLVLKQAANQRAPDTALLDKGNSSSMLAQSLEVAAEAQEKSAPASKESPEAPLGAFTKQANEQFLQILESLGLTA